MAPPPDNALIARLPRTFAPALREKLNGWEFLFPAERRLLKDNSIGSETSLRKTCTN